MFFWYDECMTKLVLFDFDGTIADSFGIIYEIFKTLVPQKEELSKQQIQEFRNKPYNELLSHFGINVFKVPGLLIKGRQMLRSSIDKVEPFEGIAEVIKELHGAQCQLGILSSNSTHNIKHFLAKYGLESCFDMVHGNIGLLGKPKVIRAMMRRARCNATETAYIGDEPRDVDAAHKVGVQAIAVTWGFTGEQLLKTHHPDHIVHTPRELASAVTGK